MEKFDFRRFFSSDSSPASKKVAKQRRGRLCRIEELEGREMLSVSPWTLIDTFEAGCRLDTSSAECRTLLLGDQLPTMSPALQPLGETVIASDTAKINAKYGLNLTPGVSQWVGNEFELRSALANSNIDIIILGNPETDDVMIATGGEFTINRSVAIVSLADDPFSIEVNWRSRIFNIACNADVTLAGLRLTKGYVNGNGGAIYNNGTLTMADCVIEDNIAQQTNLYSGHAGGIYNNGALSLRNCTFERNVSIYNGGAVYNTGTFTATDCTFVGNWADNTGGGILGLSGTISLTNCIIAGNTAGDGSSRGSSSGGGIFSVSASITLTNCAIVGNRTNGPKGGGLFGSIYGNGGGIYSGGPLTLTNCTVAGNTATGYGGGVYLTGTLNPNIFNNTIIAKNSSFDIYPSLLVNLSGGNNLIGNGIGQNVFVNGMNGNIVGVDPQFVDFAGGDYRLAAGSPAINAGNNAFAAGIQYDLAGNPRIMGGIVDIGAYESDGTVQPPLATPLDLTCTGKTETTVSLSWTAVPDATRYELRYQRVTNLAVEMWETWTGEETSCTIEELIPGQLYEFQVRAVNNASVSVWSERLFVTTDKVIPQPPETPMDLRCIDKTTDSVALEWDAVADAAGYEVQYRTGDDDWMTVYVSETTTVIPDLAADTEYEFQVRAVNDAGDESEWSESLFVTTDMLPLEIPMNLQCTGTTTNSVSLEWSGVNEATGYEIQWRKTSEEKWTLWTGSPTTNTSATVSGLTADTEYEFQVRAVDGDRVSEWSNSVIEKTHAEAADVPTNVHVTDTTDDSISLAWDAVAGATGYEIRYRIIYNPGSGQWSSENITFTDNTAVISGLLPDTTYEFQVRAIRGGPGNAGWSEGVLAKTKGTYEIPREITVASELLLPPITEELNTVAVSVTTEKFTAGKLKAVKKGVNKPTLSSVSFSLTPNSRVNTKGSDVVFEIAVYAGKVKKTSQPIGTIKISADGTVLDNGGFMLADKIEFTKPLTIDGLSASTKYTFFAKSVATDSAGNMVESRVSKVRIATLKYKTVSGLKVTDFASESISLQWKVNTQSLRYDASDTYEVYYVDSQGKECILTAVTSLESKVNGKIVTGTFERGEVGYGTVLYVRAVKVITTELQSLTSTELTSTEAETVVVKSQTAKVKVR